MGVRISCIIPTKDRAALVFEAIQSALSQEGLGNNRLEVVVVDDGSRDNTVEAIKREFPEVVLVKEKGLGPGPARNVGAAHCSGDILMFLDSDDIWYSRHARLLLDTMEKKGCKASFGVTFNRDLESGEEFFIPGGREDKGFVLDLDPLEALCHWCFMVPSSFAISKDAFFEAGGFPHVSLGEDWFFFLRCAKGFNIGFIDEVITERRLHRESLCRNEVSSHTLLSLLDGLEVHLKDLGLEEYLESASISLKKMLVKKEAQYWKSIQEFYSALLENGLIPRGL